MRKVKVDGIDFQKGGGLVPVVARENSTGKVLMLAYANRDAVQRTLDTGFAHYFSRSRGRLWKKGEDSGHVQRVKNVRIDCDRDALVYDVDQTGAACHTGEETCFFSELEAAPSREYDRLMAEEVARLFRRATLSRRRWVRDRSRREYRYLVNSVTEGIPSLKPEILEWLAGQVDRISSRRVTKVVTFEALGVPYATLLAQRRKLPLAVIRKRDFHSPAELLVRVPYVSGFERGSYFVYGVESGDKVLLIDDMVSTGGSLIPVIRALREKGVRVADVVCIAEKPQYGGAGAVKLQTGTGVKVLFSVNESGGKTTARPSSLLSKQIAA